ncbi:MAG TPA: hypothetical protein VFV52_01700 [Bacilli bacterium]|nr:hypothetical protein [Bacilli bacterium]
MKKAFLASTLVLTPALLFGCSSSNVAVEKTSAGQKLTVTSHADIPVYADLAKLTSDADAVVIGTVSNIEGSRNLARDPNNPAKEDPNILIEGVDYRVHVQEYIKGAGTKSLLITETKQKRMGKDAPMVSEEGYMELESGSTYVFFVKKSPTSGRYYGVGQPFIFEVTEGQVQAKGKNPEWTKPFKPKDLTTFIEDVKSHS